MRPILLLAAGVSLFAASLNPAEQALLEPITANTLKGHVSFLASDALEGRDTPPRGLDIAAGSALGASAGCGPGKEV